MYDLSALGMTMYHKELERQIAVARHPPASRGPDVADRGVLRAAETWLLKLRGAASIAPAGGSAERPIPG